MGAVFLVDDVADAIEESSQRYLCQKIPKLLTPGSFLSESGRPAFFALVNISIFFVFFILCVLIFESSGEIHPFLEMNDTRMWKVQLCEKVTFKQQGIPIHSDTQLPPLVRNSVGTAK
jgi:hypothetical protein